MTAKPRTTSERRYEPRIGVVCIVGAYRVEFVQNALRRFTEQVKPGLYGTDIRREVRRLVEAVGAITVYPPDWYHPQPDGVRYDPEEHAWERWLMLGDDIGFPMIETRAVSCITRCSIGEVRRQNRADRRAAAAEQRRLRAMIGPHDRTYGQHRRRLCRLRREIDEQLAPDIEDERVG